jgi:hypothetical protein
MLFKTTPPISIGSQIEDLEVKERQRLHLSHIDHITIQLELRYLIGEKPYAARPSETRWVMGWDGFFMWQNLLLWVWCGPYLGLDPNLQFGPVANTKHIMQR